MPSNYSSRSFVVGAESGTDSLSQSRTTRRKAEIQPSLPLAQDGKERSFSFETETEDDFPDPFAEEELVDSKALVKALVPVGVSDAEIIEAEVVVPVSESEFFGSDIFTAFARFLQIEVANGDATDDTVRAYYREVDFWARWCQKNGVLPEAARRIHVEMYREEMKLAGLNVTTRCHKLSIVRRFYDGAVRAGLREDNPAAGVKGGKDLTPGEEKIKSLTASALSRLIEVVPGDSLLGRRDRAIIALMAVHGLRRVEVERLNETSLEIDGDSASLEVRGKGNKLRKIFLRPDTYAALVNYLNSKHEAGLPVGGACFVSLSNRSRGERISRRSLNDIVDRYLSASSLKRSGVSCHALRHTFGTLAVAGGAKIEHLRDAMGHGRIETTGLYVKAVERVKNNPANFIDVEF